MLLPLPEVVLPHSDFEWWYQCDEELHTAWLGLLVSYAPDRERADKCIVTDTTSYFIDKEIENPERLRDILKALWQVSGRVGINARLLTRDFPSQTYCGFTSTADPLPIWLRVFDEEGGAKGKPKPGWAEHLGGTWGESGVSLTHGRRQSIRVESEDQKSHPRVEVFNTFTPL